MPKKTTFKLEERIELFIAAYLADLRLDSVAAARAAGYEGDENTLAVQGHRLLAREDVRARIRKAIQKRAMRTEVTADKVVLELARIAFADLTDYGSWDEEGRFTALPSGELKKHATRAVKELKYRKVTIGGRGDETIKETTVDLKLHDKIKALELLMRHLGMLEHDDETPDDPESKPRVTTYLPEVKRERD